MVRTMPSARITMRHQTATAGDITARPSIQVTMPGPRSGTAAPETKPREQRPQPANAWPPHARHEHKSA
jgi:hypothetical protein